MDRIRIRNTLLTLAAIAAALFLIATYGTALPGLPFASVPLNGPVTSDSNGELTAIADTESRRVLILNADGDLTGVVDCTTFDSPIEAVSDVRVSDGYIYVAGAKYFPDSTAIETERVAVYDKGGNYQGLAFEQSGTSEGTSSLKSLARADGGVVVCRVVTASESQDSDNADPTNLKFDYVNLDETIPIAQKGNSPIDIFDISYSSELEGYVVLDSRGFLEGDGVEHELLFPDNVFTAVDLSAQGITFACDDATGSLYKISSDGKLEKFASGDVYDDVHVNKETVSFNDRSANKVEVRDIEGRFIGSYSSVTPSFGYSMRMLLVWICGLYLAVLAIVLIVRKTRRAIATGQTQAVGPLLTSVAVVVAIAVAISTMSSASYQTSLERRSNEINMCSDYLASEAEGLSEVMQRCDNRKLIRLSGEELSDAVINLVEASSEVSRLVAAANDNNIGLYFTIYGKDDQGMFYLIGSNGDHVLGTSVPSSLDQGVLAEAFETSFDKSGKILNGSGLRDATHYRLVQIPTSDGKGIAGVIEVGSNVRAFDALVAGIQAQRLLALLVTMLVVFLAYSEIRACGRCLYTYRKLQERQARDAVAALTRPFTLGITMLSSIDAVMTVLIARELLSAAKMEQSGALLALPAIMLGLGLIAGQLLYGVLGSRVGLRRLMSLGAIAMLLCALLTAAAVAWGGFWAYCAAKLAMAVPFGLLYTLGYSLPRIAEHEESRAAAAGGVKRTDTSAAALGTVLGGYAAQALGNAWVYIIVAAACFPVILMALNLLPKGSAPPEQRNAQANSRAVLLKFVGSRKALCIALLVVLPATIAAGYTSFVFPLFSVDLGLEKSEINNIFVLGQLIVYLCINAIEGIEGRQGKWRTVVTALALLGAVFLLFSLNTTLVWSIVVVAFVGVLGKTTDGWKALWQRSASDVGVAAGHATSTMFATRSIALIVQPFILGALVGAAESTAVIVIGAICVLCATLFFFLTRKTSLPAR